MNPVFMAYGALALAIISEVVGSSFLQRSEQFTRVAPTIAMAVCFIAAFFFLSQALKVLPLGVAYAIWGGVGIVLTTLVGVLVFRQTLDLAGMLGIAMIVGGVLIMNLLSRSAAH